MISVKVIGNCAGNSGSGLVSLAAFTPRGRDWGVQKDGVKVHTYVH